MRGSVCRASSRGSQAGFSLIELIVAMTVTLFISGAIVQLMIAGQDAFRKEPEASDRQQNTRVAMDIIARDVYRAGDGLPQIAQVFGNGLDGGAGPDQLLIFAGANCPTLAGCNTTNAAGKITSVTTRDLLVVDPSSTCYQLPAAAGGPLVLLGQGRQWAMYRAQQKAPAATPKCAGSVEATPKNDLINFPHPTGMTEWQSAGWDPTKSVDFVIQAEAVQYRINPDTEGIPNLERSADGGISWEILSRGIEDLQVQYQTAASAKTAPPSWLDVPGLVTCDDLPAHLCANPSPGETERVVQRVRIRLVSRVVGPNQLAANVAAARRGELVSEVAPRAATYTLGMYHKEM
jgi:prepilin-type N-terminal cleavage/methylation domain-containing protein